MENQDWTPIVFNKNNKNNKENQKSKINNTLSLDEKEDIIEIAPKISLSNSLLIQKSRLNKKYTQSEVAKLLNIDVNIYKKYESGKITPNYNYLVKLEKILNVKLNKKKSQ